ncbi:hypothetical protein CMUS01_09436 [Colletotrichum musicola]|uniref:Uncharacterized protein n=1 Tax=Colletotrichum musicola TaxID=2175873 RepID=A0A8H6K810_9PEZI|nr:hypothetical protein CMUS01_09436 [Colletotrichum musicola]
MARGDRAENGTALPFSRGSSTVFTQCGCIPSVGATQFPALDVAWGHGPRRPLPHATLESPANDMPKNTTRPDHQHFDSTEPAAHGAFAPGVSGQSTRPPVGPRSRSVAHFTSLSHRLFAISMQTASVLHRGPHGTPGSSTSALQATAQATEHSRSRDKRPTVAQSHCSGTVPYAVRRRPNKAHGQAQARGEVEVKLHPPDDATPTLSSVHSRLWTLCPAFRSLPQLGFDSTRQIRSIAGRALRGGGEERGVPRGQPETLRSPAVNIAREHQKPVFPPAPAAVRWTSDEAEMFHHSTSTALALLL